MTEATLTFPNDDIEKLMRSIAREEIAKYVSEKMAAAMKLVVAAVAKSIAAKGPQTSNANLIDREKLAEALKAKLAERRSDDHSS